MGVSVSKTDAVATKVNNEIEKEIRKQKTLQDKIIKLLLLGGPQSGKSTVVKQMRITKDSGFSKEEIVRLTEVIRQNTIDGICQILSAMQQQLLIHFENKETESEAKTVTEFAQKGYCEKLPPDIVLAIQRLWRNSQVQHAYRRGHEFDIRDSTGYFLDSIERIGSSDFVPTEQDVLRSRIQTTGVVEVKINLVGALELRIIDVGGQRSERKKWIHCFQNVSAVVFVSALSDYDQTTTDDTSKTNRLLESLQIFSWICNNDFFVKSSMILFLNKKDTFQNKLKHLPIDVCFPEYKGPSSFEPCVKYIQSKFRELNQVDDRQIYSHITCATDTAQMKFVIDSVFNLLQERFLKKFGLA